MPLDGMCSTLLTSLNQVLYLASDPLPPDCHVGSVEALLNAKMPIMDLFEGFLL